MKTLIFQVVLKQWDKSQRTDEHLAIRNAVKDRQTIQAKPEFVVLGAQCILDQYAINFSDDAKPVSGKHAGRELKKAMLANGAIKLDKLVISKTEANGKALKLQFENDKAELHTVGELNNNWMQVKYQWRYSVEKNNQIFWLYEDTTINVAYVDKLNARYFLTQASSECFDEAKLSE